MGALTDFWVDCWALKAAYPSDKEGTGGGGDLSSLPPLKSLMKPLFLCFKPLPPGEEFVECRTTAGSESRRSTLTGVPLTMLLKACLARAPALMDRALALEATPLDGL